MNRQKTENSSSSLYCNSHPKEILVGICPLCLNEKLLVLASQQRRRRHLSSLSCRLKNLQKLPESSYQKKSPTAFPRCFAFFRFFKSRNQRSHRSNDRHHHESSSIISPDDSFISIKFGDNGATSWDKGKVSKISLDQCKVSWGHSTKETKREKPQSPLTWQKHIGQIFHVISLKTFSLCHVSTSVKGVKVSRSWIWRLAKRKAPN